MSLPADRGSCPVLSKREREQNRSLHLPSRTVRTALEQVEQVEFSPREDLFWDERTSRWKRGNFSGRSESDLF